MGNRPSGQIFLSETTHRQMKKFDFVDYKSYPDNFKSVMQMCNSLKSEAVHPVSQNFVLLGKILAFCFLQDKLTFLLYIAPQNQFLMATCVIIDDEKHARLTLEQWIKRYLGDRLDVAATASSVNEGVEAIKKHKPDLVFLDIEMPEQNGFALFDHFDEIPFQVVFSTAYDQYAIEAIKVAAFDYLLKPVSQDELKAMMDRFEKRKLTPECNQARVNTLIDNNHSDGTAFHSIALPTRDGYKMEKISSIIYCKAQESYCHIYLNGQPGYLVSRSLKEMEEMLPQNLFFRIHKSFLINLNYIETYKKPGGYIELRNGERLEVAYRRSDEFLQRLTRRQ
jgi:two-component system, LytTR family, response regulator